MGIICPLQCKPFSSHVKNLSTVIHDTNFQLRLKIFVSESREEELKIKHRALLTRNPQDTSSLDIIAGTTFSKPSLKNTDQKP